ncbi:putative flavin-binding monooxygenase-like protein [Neofusicoccum parvum]|nr:putative flavin-binding monooxygenase-like protein [Neofusicoccum parvum]
MADVERADIVVVGAGFHGLAMARTYLKLNPTASLLILDAGISIGGVWASDRLYPFLRTISQWGHFEYSDFPMTGYGVQKGEHMRGDVIRQYLEDYADFFDLKRLTRCNSTVQNAEDKGADGWLLTVSIKDGEETTSTYQLHASKLVIATGLTSTPAMPSFPGQDSFNATLIHSRDFGAHSSTTLQPGKTIAVLSGNKSACDVVYAHAASGASVVHWIIRSSGHGPCWMAPPRATPLQILVEKLITTRAVTWLNPCIWGPADGFGLVRRLLNQSAWGQRLQAGYARGAQAGIEKHNAYGSHPELAKLRPWNDVFWIGTGRGLLNYERSLLDLVREGRVKVHVADIAALGPRSVQLSNGDALDGVDALVCCTGWRHEASIRFTRDGLNIEGELGLPHAYEPPVDDARASLIATADSEILRALPRLRDQPPPAACPPHLAAAQTTRREKPPPAADPASLPPPQALANAYALYRLAVPPSRVVGPRTLAFTGATRTASTALVAQTQALWLSAFFMRRLPHLEVPATSFASSNRQALADRVAYEAVLHARYGRWRYPLGFGAVIPDFLFDALPYFDLLLAELGLRRWRKGWLRPWREVFEYYGPGDYKGLVEEWAAKEGVGEEGKRARRRRNVVVGVAVVAVAVAGVAGIGAIVHAELPEENGELAFETVSYTWGDPARVSGLSISGEGGQIGLTLNLSQALPVLTAHSKTDLLWIDQLCINQDDVHEKGHQVSMMDRIYKTAIRVLIWLGPADDDSDKVTQWVAALADFFTHQGNPPNMTPGDPAFHADRRAILVAGTFSHRGTSPIFAPAIHRFLHRPWFSRGWIVQELLLSRAAVFLAGATTTLSEQDIRDLITVPQHLMPPDLRDGTQGCYHILLTLKHHPPAATTAQPLAFLRLMSQAAAEFATSQRRDRLFAFLGLADVAAFTPSYASPLPAAFAAFAAALATAHGCLDFLSLCAARQDALLAPSAYSVEAAREIAALPSWAPSWTAAPLSAPFRLATGGVRVLRHDVAWDAGAGRRHVGAEADGGVEQVVASGRLRVRGRVVDRVQAVSGAAFFRPWDADDAYLDGLVAEIARDLPELAAWTRTEMVGFLNVVAWNGVRPEKSAEEILRREPLRLHPEEDPDWAIDDRSLGLTLSMAMGRRFMRSEQGRTGLVPKLGTETPSGGKPGSAIAVLHGCSVPVVLEKQDGEENVYKLVGDCYVEGIMFGEAVEWEEKDADTLILV